MSSSGVEEREDQHRDGQRQRTQTSRPDLYSASKTFGLPLGPSDGSSRISTHGRCVCLCTPRESTHTQVCIVCLFTHTYLSLRIVSIPISFLHSFFFALVSRLTYTDSQMRMALLYICLHAMRRMQMKDNILIVEI